ncbi:hypothetical protein COO60DRAFT_1516837 [Scenedesmus sp. NREL 46B-D3]|nr:hypothetical protein COO60DRAFT_1516837 [Scenedesmus sp. NREL 46B-D3]
MPNDPDDPPLFQTVTLAAIVGCLSEYMASENPSKLWRPPEYGKPLLAFTVIAAPAPADAAAAAPAQSSAAARSAAAGATSEATRGSAQTAEKARKGKQKQQPWHDYLKELIRNTCRCCSMYYLQGDKAKDAAVNRVKNLAHEFVVKRVLVKHDTVDEKTAKKYKNK